MSERVRGRPAILDAVEHEDLRSLGTEFRVPFFVFQGALDNVTPVDPVRESND